MVAAQLSAASSWTSPWMGQPGDWEGLCSQWAWVLGLGQGDIPKELRSAKP